MEWMAFSRKNYRFPVLQVHPHSNFSDEVQCVDSNTRQQHQHIVAQNSKNNGAPSKN